MTTGAFTFQPTSGFISQSVDYVLVDGDGDTAGNTLTFTASGGPDHAPIVRDDHVITNISGASAAIAIPSWALLYNDTDADGQAITVTATSGASSGSVTPNSGNPIATVTFTDNGDSNGGSFVYTGSTDSPASSDTGTVTINRTNGSTLTGTGFGEILLGGTGNDTLIGHEGNDVLLGGGGNDTYQFGLTDGNDIISDTSGTDAIQITAAPTSIDFTRSGNDLVINVDTQITVAGQFAGAGTSVETIAFTAGGTVYGLSLGTSAYNLTTGITGGTGNDVIVGTSAGETLTGGGSTGTDLLFGGDGDDTLNVSGSGAHLLVGGTGNDTLNGGSGNDTYGFSIGDGTDTINETAGGTDTIFLNLNGASLTSLRAYDDNVATNTGNLVIQYDGGQISVTNLYANIANDQVELISFGGGSFDGYAFGTSNYTINHDDTSGTNPRVVSGSSGNDFIAGEDGTANSITGGSGNDLIFGGSVDDVLTGGTGSDLLVGGAGNDTFNLANGDFGAGETIDGGAGSGDAIVLTNGTTVNFTTGTVTGVEILTGSGSGDTATMSAAQWSEFTTINLGGGTDTLNVVAIGDISALGTPSVSNVETGNLTGTAGDDTVTLTGTQLDAIITGSGTINLGGGTDTINLTSTSADLNVLGATNASISGVEAISTVGATSAVTITLTGQTEAFTVTSGVQGDTLAGGGGADVFVMNIDDARDVINGNGGNDTVDYSAYSTGLTVVLNGSAPAIVAGSGTTAVLSDTVQNVENFIGGSGNDIITGDGNANTIAGGAGADSLVGGGGNDTIVGDQSDTLLDGGSGTDTLQIGADFTSNSDGQIVNIQDVLLTTAGTTLNLSNQTEGFKIIGSSGADTIIGGSGDDTINGQAGNDILTGGGGADQFRLRTNSGTNTITDFTMGTDKIGFLDTGSTGSGSVNFANTTGTAAGTALNASDFLTHANVSDISNSDDNSIIEITNAQTTGAIQTTTISGGGSPINDFIVVFNSTTGRGEIWFDTDWSNTANRVQIATLDNVTTLAQLTAITASDIVVYNSAVDPLILDLGAPGIALSSLDNGVSFDINGDSILDQVAWTTSNDGILAYDLNGSGTIDSGAEIFSPYFAGGNYASGLAALASLNSNGDSVIDSADASFAKLLVWQDVNHDGVADAGELWSLADLGITAISLDATPANGTIDGQALLSQGSFSYTNGTAGTFVEVAVDTALGTAPELLGECKRQWL